ncbi:MAG: hypothetical protein QOJ21_791 [Solirubrobacteraceae bacterium]|jgi:hypothetical protein|nr:hypothetical protein [Solirubrobacteraceae bacterium]
MHMVQPKKDLSPLMRHLDFHAAAALMTLMALICLIPPAGLIVLLDSAVAIPAAIVAAFVTFQALRVPVGRTAGRLLER